MKYGCLELPDGVVVRGELAYGNHTQDVVEVGLPSGYTVDVGWYPEDNPLGCYYIRVFYGDWDFPVGETVKLHQLDAVKKKVEELAVLYLMRLPPHQREPNAKAGDVLAVRPEKR